VGTLGWDAARRGDAGLLVSLCRVGGDGLVQRLKLFLVLDDGLGVDLDPGDLDVNPPPLSRTFC